MQNQKAVRDSNIELLRILMMLVIIAHHYIVNSGTLPLAVNCLSENMTGDGLGGGTTV